MRVKVNPILKKELMLGARTVKLSVAVMCYSGCMALVALGFLATTSNEYISAVDYSALTNLFLVLAFLQMGLIFMIMPVLTAGSIAGERERQTLDLLLTAPVSSLSVIAGKLGSALCSMMLFVISSLPAMSVAFIYGGIQWSYLLVFLIGILILAFFSGSIGVWCAAWCKKTILSIIMTLVIEGVFLFGTLVLASSTYLVQLWTYYASSNTSTVTRIGYAPLLLLLNPATGFIDAVMKTYSGSSLINELVSSLGVGTIPKFEQLLFAHWYPFCFLTTVLIALFFVKMAAVCLETARRKESYQKPAKKK